MRHARQQHAYRREVVGQLYTNNIPTIVVGAIVSALLAFMLWLGRGGTGALVIWLALVEAVYAGRYLLSLAYFRAQASNLRAWLTRFRAGLALQGALWGSASFLLFPTNIDAAEIAFLFAFSGLAAGAATAFGIDIVSVLWFEVPLTAPLVTRLLSLETAEYIAMAAMVLMYMAYVSVALPRSSAAMRDNLRLRLAAARREAEARERSALLDGILDNEPECVKVISPDGVLQQMNKAGLAMLEVGSVEEANAAGVLNFVHPDHRAAFSAMLDAVCQGISRQLEFQVIGKHGTLRWLETNSTPLRNAAGEITGLLGVTRNITARKQADEALHKSEQRYRMLAAGTFEGIAVMANLHLVDVNDQLARLLGCTRERLLGRPVLDFVAREDHQRVVDAVASGQERVGEYTLLRCDGAPVLVEVHGQTYQQDGVAMRLIAVRDITGRRQAEREVRIAATAFEAQEGLIITDEQANILRVNKAFTDITGYSAEDVIGKNPRLLGSGRHDKAFFAAMWQEILAKGSWSGEVWNRRKDGRLFPEHLTITSVKDAAGKVSNYVGSLTDITQRKASEEEIQRLAFYDHLTGLPNRRLFMDRLKQALAGASRSRRTGALLFIDMDNFKNLNDTLGHDYGDMLLRQIALRLTASVREGDTVARLGGDEFVVLLEDLAASQADAVPAVETVGRKIQEVLGQPYDLNGVRYASTPSIGVTLMSGPHADAENLLKQADIAMYQAKKSGRDTLRFFDEQMQEAINRRAALEADLRNALEQDQIALYYQVQKTGLDKTVGAEVLVRWKHPERGMIPPAEFIPLAEETGLILPLGKMTIERVCAQLKAWEGNTRTRALALAVNVSARQFHQPHFAEEVVEAIRRHGINPGRLKLELTESLVLQNVEDTILTMSTLNNTGVQISLDDFGTGYSSLQYLRRLPLDQLKIDQSFVRDLGENAGALAIVQTIIAMADSMGLDIIAEGVETEQQRRILQKNGCTHFQGYLFGMPMPLEAFEAALLGQPETA